LLQSFGASLAKGGKAEAIRLKVSSFHSSSLTLNNSPSYEIQKPPPLLQGVNIFMCNVKHILKTHNWKLSGLF